MSLQVDHVTGENPTTATDQTLDITGFGQPDAAIYLYSRNAASYDALTSRASFSIGFAAYNGSTTDQYVSSGVARNGVSTTNTNRRQATDEIQMRLKATGTGTIDAEANFKQWNTDGSTITWGVADSTARFLSAIYFRQNNSDYTAKYKTGTFTHSTGTGTSLDVTDLGASADIVFISSAQLTTDDTGTADWIQTIGIYLKGQYQGSVNFRNEDAVGTTDTQGYLSSSKVFVEMAGGSTSAELAITDNANGFTVTKTVAATSIECGYLAISTGQTMDLWGGDFVVPNLLGDKDVTDINFPLNYLFTLISQASALDTLDSDNQAGSFGLGFANGTATADQIAYGNASEDNLATSDEDGLVSQGIWTGANNSSKALLRGRLKTIADSQFTIDWNTSNLTNTGKALGFAIGASYVDMSASFSGAGTMGDSLNRLTELSATAFSGSGTMGDTLSKIAKLDATAFGGSGTMGDALSGIFSMSAAFSGAGTMGDTLSKIAKLDATAFGGSGTLGDTLSRIAKLEATAFGGSGTIGDSLNRLTPFEAASFDGVGTIGDSLNRLTPFEAASFDGVGTIGDTLTVIPGVTYVDLAAAISGLGTMGDSLNRLTPFEAASFGGTGTVAGTLNRLRPLAAAFDGTGTLAGTVSKIAPLSPTAFSAISSFDIGGLTLLKSLQSSFSGSGLLAPTMSRYLGLVSAPFTGVGTFAGILDGGLVVPDTQYERIQRSLIDAANAGPFYEVTYSAATDKLTVTDTQIAPVGILAQEVDSNFGTPTRHRTSYRFERKEWPWTLHLRFNQSVTVEDFEESLAANPIVLARDVAKGLQQVILEISDSSYEHPPHNQPSTGTRAVIRLLARVSPI